MGGKLERLEQEAEDEGWFCALLALSERVKFITKENLLVYFEEIESDFNKKILADIVKEIYQEVNRIGNI